ncbi:MAG TPA: hypothetical protein VL171_00825 [Verrucomicrobiae bacterium]|nr:hypothetical protein [Verrucomicrobiae bacterium]
MSTLTAIDEVHPRTSRSVCNNETLEEIQKRYPGAEVMAWDDFITRKEKALSTGPVEIDEGKWFYALEVLPPARWHNGTEWNSFHLSELVSGRIASWYIRHKGRYWECQQCCDIERGALHALVLIAERLFIGVFPCGISYADAAHGVAGDYKRLAFLPFATLELKVEPDCPPELAERIRADAAVIQMKRGQPYQVSTCGQTVILGEAA